MSPTSLSLPGKPTSLWLDTTPNTGYSPLLHDETVDVAIVGGGLVGLTAATLLKAEGKTVAVIEADRIVRGVTGYTSAKVTSQHSLIYRHLIDHFGKEKARAYGEANQSAIAEIARLVEEKKIDCDFAHTEAYTYTEADDEVERIRSESDAAIELGLPASFTEEVPLPVSAKAAVRFDRQAQFHPRRYLLALVRGLSSDGSHIFENTRVTGVEDGEPCTVTTKRGTLKARSVIVASHYPFGDKMLYATRLHSHRSYVLALRVADEGPRGMFISTEPYYSVRSHPVPGGELVLVGGEGHTTGEGGDTADRYRRLEQWARERFDIQSVEYRWSTQDNRTVDRVPFVGRYGPTSRHVYVATGFGGWGMTNGTAAAMLLRDQILDRKNPWTDVFDPNRLKCTGVPDMACQAGAVAKHFVADRKAESTPDALACGEARIVETDDGKAAIYKTEDGTLHALSPVCTHMGCYVQWNSAEKSWDCPCHGSRFDIDGKVLQGPAVEDLEKKVVK